MSIELVIVTPQGEAELPEALSALAGRGVPRGWLVVISDLHAPRDELAEALGRWRHAGHETTVFHLQHAEALRLPRHGEWVFTDSEDGRELSLDLGDAHADFEKQMRADREAWRRSLGARGVDYAAMDTLTPPAAALHAFTNGSAGRR